MLENLVEVLTWMQQADGKKIKDVEKFIEDVS